MVMMARWCFVVLFIAGLAGRVHAELRHDPRNVYGRLIAPCCWTQTLDIHDSPLATELRVEIAERLARGEEPLAIEDSMAARFGERVRAVPRGQDPRESMGLVIGSAMGISLLALIALAARWRRRLRSDAPALDDEYDAELERELERLNPRVRRH